MKKENQFQCQTQFQNDKTVLTPKQSDKICKNWLVYLPNANPTILNIFTSSILMLGKFPILELGLLLVFFCRLNGALQGKILQLVFFFAYLSKIY